MGNPWLMHLKKYHADHPNLSYREAMMKAKATYKPVRKMRGGNPAVIGQLISAIPGAVGSIGDSIKKGVETQHQFNKDNGALAAEIIKRKAQLLRDLKHERYWDPEKMPTRLRLKKFGINPPNTQNRPENSDKLDRADEALEDYVDKQFEKYQDRIDGKRGSGKRRRVIKI